MAEQTPDSIITTQRNGQTIVAELFFNHSSTETFRDKLLKLVLADSSCLSASDGQEPAVSTILEATISTGRPLAWSSMASSTAAWICSSLLQK